MDISEIIIRGTWADVYNLALKTVNKDKYVTPSDEWKKRILLAEHSPIRARTYQWTWYNIPYWVSNHFVRHKYGIEHFVTTQRSDRTGVQRDELPQDTPVNHTCVADAQALINISRKRFCRKAAPETRRAWGKVWGEINVVDPIMAEAMVEECVYRGFCPEMKSCEFYKTNDYQELLRNYRRIKNEE